MRPADSINFLEGKVCYSIDDILVAQIFVRDINGTIHMMSGIITGYKREDNKKEELEMSIRDALMRVMLYLRSPNYSECIIKVNPELMYSEGMAINTKCLFYIKYFEKPGEMKVDGISIDIGKAVINV